MALRESSGIAAEFSFENEKAIAKSFSQRFQWEMILIGLGQAAIWLSLWPLVLNGFLDLWLGFLIASLCACFAYLPSHEAQHGNGGNEQAQVQGQAGQPSKAPSATAGASRRGERETGGGDEPAHA